MKNGLAPRWTFRHDRPADAQRLRQEAGFPELTARILANRELSDPRAARRFVDAPLADIRDPFELPGVDAAARRVARAIANAERITVYGDYDVDGVCATALMIALFDFLGVEAGYYIPHRAEEGYGLNREAVDKLAARGTRLLLTVDNGVTAVDEIAYAASLGIDTVVTDHHEAGERLPAACAIVDPKRPDCPYPHGELSGTGVAWKVAHAILRELGTDAARGREFLKSLFDLVALATIADVAPLVGENRILARAGMAALQQTARPGLRALMDVAGVNGAVSTRAIGFQLAPRLNAVGRTRSAMLGVRLLLSKDLEEARKLAAELDALNTERQNDERRLLKEVSGRFQERHADGAPRAIVVWGEGWEVGLVGLIASRLCEQYYRPAFVINVDSQRGTAKGSARSIAGFNLVEALQACSASLTDFGGHTMAAGLRLPAGAVERFRDAMVGYAERALTDEMLRPELLLDAELPLATLTLEAAEALAALEPFGAGHPRPLVAFPGLSLADTPRVVGSGHLRLRLAQGGAYVSAIGFGMSELDSRLMRHQGSIAVAGHPVINDYRGRRTPEIEIKDIRFER